MRSIFRMSIIPLYFIKDKITATKSNRFDNFDSHRTTAIQAAYEGCVQQFFAIGVTYLNVQQQRTIYDSFVSSQTTELKYWNGNVGIYLLGLSLSFFAVNAV